MGFYSFLISANAFCMQILDVINSFNMLVNAAGSRPPASRIELPASSEGINTRALVGSTPHRPIQPAPHRPYRSPTTVHSDNAHSGLKSVGSLGRLTWRWFLHFEQLTCRSLRGILHPDD